MLIPPMHFVSDRRIIDQNAAKQNSMLFNIIWSSLWLVGCTLLVLFYRRISIWSENWRIRHKHPTITPIVKWNVKRAFQIHDLFFICSTLLWSLFAFNSALSLYRAVSMIVDHNIPELLRIMVNIYSYLWILIMLSIGITGLYAFITSYNNDFLIAHRSPRPNIYKSRSFPQCPGYVMR